LVILCIPDERPIPEHQVVNIKTIRKKTFPSFGKVIDVTWKGNDNITGLAHVFSHDVSVKNLAKKIGNLVVHSYAKEFQGGALQVDRRFKPLNQD
jgi:hypothetical protein